MMASHGFMISHPWAKEVRMVLNMDSTGIDIMSISCHLLLLVSCYLLLL
jgi:hypothetical protein